MSLQAALVEHGSPTLAGLKPASLFRYQPEEGGDFAGEFLACRRELEERGLVLTLLKGCRRTGAYLVYLYRKEALAGLLDQPDHRDFLREMGYEPWTESRGCLRQLAARLFLGYPLSDVKGFIRHKGKNFTLCGCWKCYGDPRQAARQFRRFKECTNVYRRRFAAGATLRQLTVAA